MLNQLAAKFLIKCPPLTCHMHTSPHFNNLGVVYGVANQVPGMTVVTMTTPLTPPLTTADILWNSKVPFKVWLNSYNSIISDQMMTQVFICHEKWWSFIIVACIDCIIKEWPSWCAVYNKQKITDNKPLISLFSTILTGDFSYDLKKHCFCYLHVFVFPKALEVIPPPEGKPCFTWRHTGQQVWRRIWIL